MSARLTSASASVVAEPVVRAIVERVFERGDLVERGGRVLPSPPTRPSSPSPSGRRLRASVGLAERFAASPSARGASLERERQHRQSGSARPRDDSESCARSAAASAACRLSSACSNWPRARDAVAAASAAQCSRKRSPEFAQRRLRGAERELVARSRRRRHAIASALSISIASAAQQRVVARLRFGVDAPRELLRFGDASGLDQRLLLRGPRR